MDTWAQYCEIVDGWVEAFKNKCIELGVHCQLSDYEIEREIMPSINDSPFVAAAKYCENISKTTKQTRQ